MKTKSYSFIAGLFFILLVIFLFSYLLFLRNQNVIESRKNFSQIVQIYQETVSETGIQELFVLFERQFPTLQGILFIDANGPLAFWGNEQILREADGALDLFAPDVSQELLEQQSLDNIRISAVFIVLDSQVYFYLARAGLVSLIVFITVSLFYYWFSNRKKLHPKPQSSPDRVPTVIPIVSSEPVSAITAPETPILASTLVYSLDALEDRLAGELHRAGSNQMDVSLGLISTDLVDETEFHSILREHFMYKDVLFRENEKSCWVILPQMDLDRGIEEVERFMSTVRRRYATGSDGKNPRKPPVFTCGISSRNGRILGPARLVKEARQALKKTGPEALVIGFRTNSEQYRKFILRQQD